MSFLKSLVRRVKKTVTAVAAVTIGGALSRAVGAAIRPLGSKITRNLGSLFRSVGSGITSIFTRKANTPAVAKNNSAPPSTFGGGGFA